MNYLIVQYNKMFFFRMKIHEFFCMKIISHKINLILCLVSCFIAKYMNFRNFERKNIFSKFAPIVKNLHSILVKSITKSGHSFQNRSKFPRNSLTIILMYCQRKLQTDPKRFMKNALKMIATLIFI